MHQLLDFSGRTVVITGAASGIGAATAEAFAERGAVIHTLDVIASTTNSDRLTHHQCDLADPHSIDRVVNALPGDVDVLVNCAGVPNGGRFTPRDVMCVNWLGLRHLTESLLPRMANGSAVVHIASTAGRDWAARVDAHQALMRERGFDEGLAWIDEHRELIGDGYAFSKEAVQYYTLWRSVQLLASGVRMNSVCPGITDTSIIADFRRGLGDQIIDGAHAVAGRFARPEEMANCVLFLADETCASYLTGVNLNVDHGTAAARLTGQSDPAQIWGRES